MKNKNIEYLITLLLILTVFCSGIGIGVGLIVYRRKPNDLHEDYVLIQDDYYYVNDNIRLLERVRNPLEHHSSGQYYLVLHYHDGTRRTVYFEKETERDECYRRVKVILENANR